MGSFPTDRTGVPARHSASKRCDSTSLGVGVVGASVHVLGCWYLEGVCASVLNTSPRKRRVHFSVTVPA